MASGKELVSTGHLNVFQQYDFFLVSGDAQIPEAINIVR